MLYIISPVLIYLITESLYLLTTLIQFPSWWPQIWPLFWLWFFFCMIPPISGIIQYLFFSVWHISLYIKPSRSFHVGINGWLPSFLWLNSILSCVCISHFLYSFPLSFDGSLDCFCILGIVNNARMNMGYKYLVDIVIWFYSDM